LVLFETDQGVTVTVKFVLLAALAHFVKSEDVYLALMVWAPVVLGAHVTVQVEVLTVAGASVHGLPVTVGFDAVKIDVPRGESLGCPAEVFVTVTVQVVGLLTVTVEGLHATEALVVAWGRGVGVPVGVTVGGTGVGVGVRFGTKFNGIRPLAQASPESPPVLFWSPSCTMNSNRYTCPGTSGFPNRSRRLPRVQRTSAP
jgi:hypothetical protein